MYAYNLLNYRLSWKVDNDGKFKEWQAAQLLGTTKCFTNEFIYKSEIKPFW